MSKRSVISFNSFCRFKEVDEAWIVPLQSRKKQHKNHRERERGLFHIHLTKLTNIPVEGTTHVLLSFWTEKATTSSNIKHQIIQGFPLLSHLILSLFPPKTVLKFRTSGLFQGGRKILKSFMGTNYFIFSSHNNSKDFKIKNHTSLATSTQSK